MAAITYSETEKSALGEVMNISLGSAATALSTLLGSQVTITTPTVRVLHRNEFEFKKLEPAVGVEITYVEGLEGSNVIMFSRNDVRVIVGILMGNEIPEQEFELDEINKSAICEVMNQMMGSSATALSEFLNMPINISTPVPFEIESEESFKEKYFPDGAPMVVINFVLKIEGKLESEFFNILPIPLADKLLKNFGEILEGGEAKEAAQPAAEAVQPAAAEGASSAAAEAGAAATKPEPAQSAAAEPAQSAAAQSGTAGTAAAESAQLAAQEAAAKSAQVTGGQSVPSQPTSVPPVSQTAPASETVAPAAAQTAANPAPAQGSVPPAGAVSAAAPVSAAQFAGSVPVNGAAPAQPFAVYAPQPAPVDPAFSQLLAQMQQTQLQMMELMRDMGGKKHDNAGAPNVIRPASAPALEPPAAAGEEEAANQEMLMRVPLEISVEIGRTKKLVKDILEFTQGSLVVLDKMAGEQADLYVNGQCVARGDIVVVEDNFGIRITEIVARDAAQEES